MSTLTVFWPASPRRDEADSNSNIQGTQRCIRMKRLPNMLNIYAANQRLLTG
ncbi:hypothetical protein M404DRAFT_996572 [Pisolithus tinctorius Marx 270]|uniref:Uncharacterized protein n=1 Tax=Pisolithus tinctorius Marx 270 TaxID=870435 RepID=A0A0C3P8C8_PISTI|nr:hypothetical protein M404DRAFT_996572 [Pisolithus tinctorius Marx 270]